MRIIANQLNSAIGNIDLYISASGFEDRCIMVGTTLDQKKIKKAIIFHIEDTYIVSSENILKIKANIPQLEIIEYPKNNPLDTFDKFYKILEDFCSGINSFEKAKIVIDITTFTREILLILVRAVSLKRFISKVDVTLIYTPAESYSSKSPQFWLTKGIREIRSVLGYPGMHSPSKTTLLIVLTGFEEERTNEVIDTFESSVLILGKPSKKSSINNDLSKISLEKYNSIKEKNKSIIIEEFEFSCSEILETKAKVIEIIKKYETDYNIIISPLNNKISTLGVALAGLTNDYVQICYASANQYNIESYSEKSDYFMIYSLNELLQKAAP